MTSPDVGDGLEAVEAALGHEFGNLALLEQSLRHASWAREHDGSSGNERLEFLGDAVLDLVISEALHGAHPDWDEGALSLARAQLVNGASLAERARAVGLPPHVRLGPTEVNSGGADKPSILANVFEAVVAAVYLDGGLAAVTPFVHRVFPEASDPGEAPPVRDPKTRLNERAHADGTETPKYVLVDDTGIDGAADRFTIEVRIGEEPRGQGTAGNKRDAERAAAAAALERP